MKEGRPKNMDGNLLVVKQKAISVLTTVYKTESTEQVAELESKIHDLLYLIRSNEDNGCNPNKSKPRSHHARVNSTETIGEIEKPFKRFKERPNDEADKQISFIQSAMQHRRDRRLKWLKIAKSDESSEELKASQKNRLNEKCTSVPSHIETEIGRSISDDDMSSIGTASTFVSFSERVAEILLVRRFIEKNGDSRLDEGVPTQTKRGLPNRIVQEQVDNTPFNLVKVINVKNVPTHPNLGLGLGLRKRFGQEQGENVCLDSAHVLDDDAPTQAAWGWHTRFTKQQHQGVDPLFDLEKKSDEEASPIQPRWSWRRRVTKEQVKNDEEEARRQPK